MADEPGYSLTFSFPDQSESFAHGFTCGQIWMQMKQGQDIDETVMVETRATIEAMAMATGWDEWIEELDDHWIRVRMLPPGSSKPEQLQNDIQ